MYESLRYTETDSPQNVSQVQLGSGFLVKLSGVFYQFVKELVRLCQLEAVADGYRMLAFGWRVNDR